MAAMAARKDRWQRALAFWDETRQVSGPGLEKRWRNGEKWRFIAGKTGRPRKCVEMVGKIFAANGIFHDFP